MEEEKIVKKEETISKEEYLKIRRSNNKKSAIIVVLVFVIILMLTLILMYYFNNKGSNEPVDNNGGNNNQVVDDSVIIAEGNSLKKIELNTNNQIVKIGNASYKIRIVKDTTDASIGSLYIDDNIIKVNSGEEDYAIYADTAYVTDKYILFTVYGETYKIVKYAIDSSGKSLNIEVASNYYDQFLDFYMENGMALATGYDRDKGDSEKIEFAITYENDTISIEPRENNN